METNGDVAAAIQFAMEFMAPYTDDVRYPLIQESTDWQKLPTAIFGTFMVVQTTWLTGNAMGAMQLLRFFCEMLYVMGYQRGKREAAEPPLEWLVAEGDDAD